MHELDSRSLGVTDCFVQRFSAPGTIAFRLQRAPAPESVPVAGGRFVIEVARVERETAESKQHNVAVRLVNGRLEPRLRRLEIEPGDTVCWHAEEPALRFAVLGEGEAFSFDSRSMRSECAYTHAFPFEGRYEWLDANGGPTAGQVEVTNPDLSDPEQRRQWTESLKKATTIKIEGAQVEPADTLRILTGQTVAWVVTRARGITVTDIQLSPRDSG